LKYIFLAKFFIIVFSFCMGACVYVVRLCALFSTNPAGTVEVLLLLPPLLLVVVRKHQRTRGTETDMPPLHPQSPKKTSLVLVVLVVLVVVVRKQGQEWMTEGSTWSLTREPTFSR
jgi:membrane protein implicated in regulation of membrane protease activity